MYSERTKKKLFYKNIIFIFVICNLYKNISLNSFMTFGGTEKQPLFANI